MSTVCERPSHVETPKDSHPHGKHVPSPQREVTPEELAAQYYGWEEPPPMPPHDHFQRVHDPEVGRAKQIQAVREQMPEQPRTVEEAVRTVQERFGCFYKGLASQFRSDPAVIEQAAIASHGTELAFAPKEALERLGTPFFCRLLEQGVIPGWVVENSAPESVVRDPAIRSILERMEQTRLEVVAKFNGSPRKGE